MTGKIIRRIIVSERNNHIIMKWGAYVYKASLIAKWFLLTNNAEMRLHEVDDDIYEGISHLKLQKLLYYA